MGAIKFGSARGAVALKIVVAENHDGVSRAGGIIHNPETSGGLKDGNAEEIEAKEESGKNDEEGEPGEKAAALGISGDGWERSAERFRIGGQGEGLSYLTPGGECGRRAQRADSRLRRCLALSSGRTELK